MDSEHVKVTVEHEKQVSNEDEKRFLDEKIPDFSSASSISSSSSSSTSSEFDIEEKNSLQISSAKSKSDGDLLSAPESISSTDSTDQTPPWSMLSASPPPAEIGPQLLTELPTADSNTKILGQPAGYDPNRIPASIFSTKATNASEWSVASNESLFSIHMGNNSFSQDHAILFGKSGELGRVDDWNFEAKSNNELSSLPPVIEHEENGLASGEVLRAHSSNSMNVNNSSSNNHGMCFENDVLKEKMACVGAANGTDFGRVVPAESTNLNSLSTPRTSTSNARLSDESGNSSSSFAFPVLVSDGIKTSSLKRVTDNHEKPPLQAQQVPKPTQKAPKQRGFCCFYSICCWPRRCC